MPNKSLLFPRPNDKQTIYLKNCIKSPFIEVGDYTIVGGMPAKPIRKRFSDEKIAGLLDMKWWDWDEEKIGKKLPEIMKLR